MRSIFKMQHECRNSSKVIICIQISLKVQKEEEAGSYSSPRNPVLSCFCLTPLEGSIPTQWGKLLSRVFQSHNPNTPLSLSGASLAALQELKHTDGISRPLPSGLTWILRPR